jgi:hypothetical protein
MKLACRASSARRGPATVVAERICGGGAVEDVALLVGSERRCPHGPECLMHTLERGGRFSCLAFRSSSRAARAPGLVTVVAVPKVQLRRPVQDGLHSLIGLLHLLQGRFTVSESFCDKDRPLAVFGLDVPPNAPTAGSWISNSIGGRSGSATAKGRRTGRCRCRPSPWGLCGATWNS